MASLHPRSVSQDILVVDDEPDIGLLIEGILNDEGFTTRRATTASDAIAQISRRRPNMVLLDIWLQDGSGIDGLHVLDQIKRDHGTIPVIIMSGHGNIETAVSAMKRGAYDYIEKPFKAERLILQVRNALEAARLRRENTELRGRIGDDGEIIGVSTAINNIRNAIGRAANMANRVLLSGPSGVGKEVIARAIHAKSSRASEPFVLFNPALMEHREVEEKLFGHVDTSGKLVTSVFEQAHGGTLYIDDVEAIPPDLQGRLIRVLHDNSIVRGDNSARVTFDVRIIASSQGDLGEAVALGTFREDLYYRLSVLPLSIPPLSKRREDIIPLAEHFMAQASKAAGISPRAFAEDALAALRAAEWPNNARQLRNVIEWLLIMAPGSGSEPIRADMLPQDIMAGASPLLSMKRSDDIMGLPFREARETFEREYLATQITRFGGNISRTAAWIGMERSALHRKLKVLGIAGNDESPAD